MSLESRLATNAASHDGVKTMADGVVPVATPVPFAAMLPLPRSTLKGETKASPWVVTKSAPVPDEVELWVEQLVSKPSPTRIRNPIQLPDFIRILSPQVYKYSGQHQFVYQECMVRANVRQ